MKKVITIHINGILFNMEEDAFSTMRETLFRHGKQNDKQTEEILSEKFSGLLSGSKQVITLSDVQMILPQLGFKVSYDSGNTQGRTNYREDNRIYRKTQGKVLGGVCAGLGEYWNLDPVILRIIFIALFFGFGVGLLFYLLLCIAIPVKN